MSTHERDEMMRTPVPSATVSRRGAIGRLLGLGAGAVAAAALPAVAEATPVAQPAPEPVTLTILPEWFQGQPDWLLANVERYAATLATLTDPTAMWLEGGHRSREGQVLRTAEFLIAGMNEPEEERAERDRQWWEERAAKEARTPRWIADARVATATIPKLTPNERRRVRRWIKKQPVGPDHPIISLRPGRRVSWSDEPVRDHIDVAQAERSYHYQETPYSLAAWAVSEVGKVIGTPLMYSLGCGHAGVYHGLTAVLPDGSLPKTLMDLRT